jgi:hypothetical protein
VQDGMKAGNRKRIIDSVAAGSLAPHPATALRVAWSRIPREWCLPKRELAAGLSPRKAVFSFRFRVLAQAYRGTREILLEPTQ